MIERVLHTTYVVGQTDEGYFLLVDKGRFSFPTLLPVADIRRIVPINRLFGLSRYLLVEYGENRMLSVEPEDESEFIAEIKKRQQS